MSETEVVELPEVATRVDHTAGYREEFGFAPFRGARVFSVFHIPLTPPRAGLVICPPILVEHLTNYRHEVLFARELASRGIAVHRFHYRGTGHSEGEESSVSMETMQEDTFAAVERLQEKTGVATIALQGTRWGGRVAGAVATSLSGAPTMLWEPVVDPSRYLRELIRGRLVGEMRDAQGVDGRAGTWVQELEREGRLDILGHALHRRLYEDRLELPLDELLATGGARSVLVIQLSRSTRLRPDFARLKEVVDRAGGRCDTRFIQEEPAWLFPGHPLKALNTLVQMSADWLVETVSGPDIAASDQRLGRH